jgi:hypothetical protein
MTQQRSVCLIFAVLSTTALADVTLIPPILLPVGSVTNYAPLINSQANIFQNNLDITNSTSVSFTSMLYAGNTIPPTAPLSDVGPGIINQPAAIAYSFGGDPISISGQLSSHIFDVGSTTYLSMDPSFAVKITSGTSGAFPLTVSALPTELKVQATDLLINRLLTTVRTDPANVGKSEHDIAALAWGAVVDYRQRQFTGTNGEFSFLKGADIDMLSGADHFLQAYDVGTGNTVAENPLTAGILGGIIDPVYNVGKLITGSNFFKVDGGTQSPANFDFWALDGAVAATKVQLGGAPPGGTTVQQPVSTDGPTSDFVEEGPGPFLVDPAGAGGFEYTVASGPGFASFEVPTQPCVPAGQSLTLRFGTQSVSLLPNQNYIFSSPAFDFILQGIMTCPGGSNFESLVSFAGGSSDIDVFSQTNLNAPASSVPEPRSLGLLAGIILFLVARNRFRR